MTKIYYLTMLSLVLTGLASVAHAADYNRADVKNDSARASLNPVNKAYNRLAAARDAHLSGEATPDKIITNISNWNHPTKKYFDSEYGFKLIKVELYQNGTYPVFHVEITKLDVAKTWSMNESYNIAVANGWWPFDLKFYYKNKYLFTLANKTDKHKKSIDLLISYYGNNKGLSFRDAYNLLRENKKAIFRNKNVSFDSECSGVEICNNRNPKYFIWLRNMKADMAGTVGRFLISPDSGVIVDWDDLNM